MISGKVACDKPGFGRVVRGNELSLLSRAFETSPSSERA